MVGGRDVSCFVEPLYWTLLEKAINDTMRVFDWDYLKVDGFDEQMGMGRDSRTLKSGLSNSQIIANSMNRIQHAMISARKGNMGASANGARSLPRLVTWADMVNKYHNGDTNYSWINGAGRKQPYWPAIASLDKNILLLSWIYDTGSYALKCVA